MVVAADDWRMVTCASEQQRSTISRMKVAGFIDYKICLSLPAFRLSIDISARFWCVQMFAGILQINSFQRLYSAKVLIVLSDSSFAHHDT